MVLWDYDAAPDGQGTYEVLNAEFPSVQVALRHRERMWCGDLYWGYIQDADGKTILNLRNRYEEEDEQRSQDDEDGWDWSEHEERCDGCPTCNPTAFRDEE